MSKQSSQSKMIETRESYQPLLNRSTPPSPGRRKKQAEMASYGTLKGEALLHADDSASSKQINGVVAHGNGGLSATPQSVDPGQYGEYQQPLHKIPEIPVQQSTNGINGGLPPAIPLRRRADSSGDRSIGELSTVSGMSGHSRLHRSFSDVLDGAGNSLSRRSRSPKPPRSHSPTPNAAPFIANGNNGNQGNVLPAGHPLHQRRSSDERSYSSRHRRTHSYDVPSKKLSRGSSSNSLYSLNSVNSQGSMNSETVKLLPDPRWGGGSGGGRARSGSGGSRARSFSGGSGMNGSLSYIGNVSYSTDSLEGKQHQVGYGSIASSSAKEVIMNGNMNGGAAEQRDQRDRGHRRTNSEMSTSTFASAASIDQSAEPVMTDMRKSALFKGLTNKGVLKLQLPKDNFRMLSDRDLESGCVYKRALVDNEDDYFQDYHITTGDDAAAIGSVPILPTTSDCQCPCTSCENYNGRRKQLPPSYYVMAVDSDIYRRMLDEVAESMNMPCKLFYCGHHADVDYPSIGIAWVGVIIILSIMLWATWTVDG
mmetsp:Transcript_5531/g.9420  ORF Transcript_5531/g.9420 Transcript_5531/m.9420 type:complete len:537 (+) Transcript_5531:96-1706(+)